MSRAVLIIDDDVNAQIIAETLLRLRGLEVQVTPDVTEAVAIIARDGIGVVLVDVNLPGVNGAEGVRRLRAAAGQLAAAPRIILTTDRLAPEIERFSQRSGADAVLRKPMLPGQFLATVERLMPASTQAAIQAG